jgi:hypothetical protein
MRSAGPGAAPGPTAGDLVLLSNPGPVGEPDLDGPGLDALLARDLVQQGGEDLSKRAMRPSA